jgi:DNA-binding beta-propeller fold protein YncE
MPIGDTVFSFVPSIQFPIGVTFDGTDLFVTFDGTSTISRISTNGTELDTIETGVVDPFGIEHNGVNLVLTNSNSGLIIVIDENNSLINFFFLLNVLTTGVTFDGTDLFIIQSNTIRKTTLLGADLDDFPSPIFAPTGIASDGKDLFISSPLIDKIHKITTKGKEIFNFDVDNLAFLEMDWDDGFLWITVSPSRIHKIIATRIKFKETTAALCMAKSAKSELCA